VRNSLLRKKTGDQWHHGITHEVLTIEAALRSHQIDNMKTAYSPNNSEYERFSVDLLPLPFWRLFSMDVRLLGVLILKDEPTLLTYDNGAELVRRHSLQQWQQLLAFLNFCGSELFSQLLENSRQMKILQVKRVMQLVENCHVRYAEDLCQSACRVKRLFFE
jgi:hypothetical protein